MKDRIHSIDIVRGLIMIIMTLDHTRDFLHYPGPSPLNMQTTTVILFFTRWITHYCAPTFVFLSGTSAFLAGQRRTKKELSKFLFTRGAWLILSDMLIISFLFTFDVQYHLVVLEVLSAIGFGMIILALLIRAPLPVIAAIAIMIIFGHNSLDYVALPQNGLSGNTVTLFLSAAGSVMPLSAARAIVVLYAVIPWTGALLLGYAFGFFYRSGVDAKRRQRILLISGISIVALFVILRLVNHYGDPAQWTIQRNTPHTILSFLNATKQVPSLLFFCMTLGPVLILLSFAEKIGNRVTAICEVYGNVPYFYFIVHLCFLRLINIGLIALEGFPMKSPGSPLVWQSPGFGHPLWAVYLFWIAVVSLLYFPCRWYGTYKRTHRRWWLSYV
ncbi:MAG: heparan-alpha-glucosaminide N-acetyltransferase domain-containing protein [Bacteroidota bacterium]|nr:heparan-alpha-glucosaminide N-acetyltransferase domain-containing protein [Bacteroidota bacterium]